MSDLESVHVWSHELKHTRLLGPSLSPWIYSNPCPLSQWCHPTISSSATPFSSCPQSFPTSWPFPMSQLFPSDGQSTGASASASVLPMNIHDWFPLGMIGLILLPKGLSTVFSNTTVQKHQFFSAQPSLWSNFHIYSWLLEKWQLWLEGPLSAKWCFWFLIQKHLSSFVVATLPRRKHPLFSWLQSPSTPSPQTHYSTDDNI